jgi:mRNA-degrading endonuclease toxin of MazEF toxin-antitoxin module
LKLVAQRFATLALALVAIALAWPATVGLEGAPSTLAWVAALPVGLLFVQASRRRYARWRSSTAARLRGQHLVDVAARGPILLVLGTLVARFTSGWAGFELDGTLAAALLLTAATSAWAAWRDKREASREQPLGAGRQPLPGEVWWAEIPFEDGRQAKDRPCLVLRARGANYEVLMLTSQDQSQRQGFLAVPVPAGSQRGGKSVSYLKLDRLIARQRSHFRRFAWQADPATLAAVRRL